MRKCISHVTSKSVDVLFLAMGHGESRAFLEKRASAPGRHEGESAIDSDVCVIDLSQDFRLAAYSKLGDRQFIYGLPEINRAKTKGAKSIADNA